MNKEQLIFLHIPKTAGTTLRNIIYAQYGETRVAPIYPERTYIELEEFNQLTAARKDQADALIGHVGYGFHRRLSGNRPYRYATMLRHPIARCLSLYNHLKNRPVEGSDLSFKEILKSPIGSQFINGQSCLISEISSLDSKRKSKVLLETALKHIELDFALVGITERFNESLLLANHTLGWNLKPYVSLNTAKQWANNYTEELKNDKESMDLLHELNETDLLLYDSMNKRLTENLNELYPDAQARLLQCESLTAMEQTDVPKAVGNLGALQEKRIVGWAKLLNTDIPAEVGLIINEGEELIVYANIRREDLLHLHYAGRCGFLLKLPMGNWLKPGDKVSARILNAGGIPLQHSPKLFAND